MKTDIVEQINNTIPILDLIDMCEVGSFPLRTPDAPFKGVHGTHDSSSTTHCSIDPIKNVWYCFSCKKGGSAFDWVLHAKYGGDKDRIPEAIQEICNYKSLEYTDAGFDKVAYEVLDTLTSLCMEASEELHKDKNRVVLEWLHTNYGFLIDSPSTDVEPTVKALRIGYLTPEVISHYDHQTLRQAGIVDSRGECGLLHRIIFPHIKGGKVRWVTGRYYGEHIPPDQKKYVALHDTDYARPIPFNYDNCLTDLSLGEAVILCEGPPDAIAAYQHGFRAMSIGGAKLTQGLMDDVITVLKKASEVYIIFDSELSQVGYDGARATARMLIERQIDPLIVVLPRQSEQSHIDLCKYLKGAPVRTLPDLLKTQWQVPNKFGIMQTMSAQTLPEMAISALGRTPNAAHIREAVSTFALLDITVTGKYIAEIKRKTGAKETELRKLVTQLRRETAPPSDWVMVDEMEGRHMYAQDFTYDPEADVWLAHTTTFAPHVNSIESEVEATPVMCHLYLCIELHADGHYTVRNKDVWPTVPDRLVGKVPDLENLMPFGFMDPPWSFSSKYPYSSSSFLNGKCEDIDTYDLYADILRFINSYVIYPHEADAAILALFVMNTYIFMGLDSTPYLYFTGTKDSGKTQSNKILGTLCFHAYTGDSTVAAVSRAMACNQATILFEDVENLKNPNEHSKEYGVLQLVLPSYAKIAGASRQVFNVNTNSIENLFCYGPKAFGGIADMKHTLVSRCIPIFTRTATAEQAKKLKPWRITDHKLRYDAQNLRDRCRVWALTKFRQIRESYEYVTSDMDIGFANRAREIYIPLLTIAHLMDTQRGTNVVELILQAAKDKLTQQTVVEAATDLTVAVIEAMYQVCKEKGRVEWKTQSNIVYVSQSEAFEAVRTTLFDQHLLDGSVTNFGMPEFLKFLRNVGVSSTVHGVIRAKQKTGRLGKFIHYDKATAERFLESKKSLAYLQQNGEMNEGVGDEDE